MNPDPRARRAKASIRPLITRQPKPVMRRGAGAEYDFFSQTCKQSGAGKVQDWSFAALIDVEGIFAEAVRQHHAGHIDEAVARYQRVLAHKPDHADAHNNLGVALAGLGRMDQAVAHCERALGLRPDYAAAHNNLATVLASLGRMDGALTHYKRAIALQPDHADAHNNLGNIYKTLGRFEAATAHYQRAVASQPAYAEAHFNLAEIKTFRADDRQLATLQTLAAGSSLPAGKMPFIHFALAKAYEDCGDFHRSFAHLRTGNHLKRTQVPYDEAANLQLFERIAAVFDAKCLNRFEGQGDPSSAPIFVLGMPRSGSTLVEQILASHPKIHAAGEGNSLEWAAGVVLGTATPPIRYPECVPHLDESALRRMGQAYLERLPVARAGAVRIVDKTLSNFLHMGLIRLILPNARIIHTVRDPLDTCISCYSKLFAAGQPFTYDLAELGRYYRSYSSLMAHWRSVLPPGAFLEVAYEDVVNGLESQARRLIEYCGLAWDHRCLAFHKTARPVTTASAVQVRKPLFRSSLERWRRYEGQIDPLVRELGDLAC